jgi:hypothetical protein
MERTILGLNVVSGLGDEKLDDTEIWWRDHQEWLEGHGYMLRPRFRPGWTPSWIITKKAGILSEDAPSMMVCIVPPNSTDYLCMTDSSIHLWMLQGSQTASL